MRMQMRAAVAALALVAALAACNRGQGESGGGAATQREAQAREDSARSEQKALRDSGVSVDTQTIDTGSVAAPPTEDN